MDSLSFSASRMGMASLVFQVFSSCIQGYETLYHARVHSEDLHYLRLRLKVEENRLLEWAEVVQLNDADDQLANLGTKQALILDVLDQIRRVLHTFGRFDENYKKLSRPLLVDYEDSEPEPSHRFPGSSLAIEEPPMPEGASSSILDDNDGSLSIDPLDRTNAVTNFRERFPQSTRLLKKSLQWAKSTSSVSKHLKWVALDKAKFEALVIKLTAHNDFLHESLRGAQLESLVLKQTRTEAQIVQLNSSIQSLLQAYAVTASRHAKAKRPLRIQDPLATYLDYLEQQGLTEAAEQIQPKLALLADGKAKEADAKAKLLLIDDRSVKSSSTNPPSYTPGDASIGTLSSKAAESILNINLDESVEGTSPIDHKEDDAAQSLFIPSPHIQLEGIGSISHENWREVVPLLPQSLRWGLEYTESCGNGTWTFTSSPASAATSVPLTIGGIPVVIPLRFSYPLRAPSSPPPDPHPFKINPTRILSASLIDDILMTFADISGFYMLLNGFLQLIMPDDFDLDAALSRNPAKFGGLKVSYVQQSMLSTASKGVESAVTTSGPSTVEAIASNSTRRKYLATVPLTEGATSASYTYRSGNPIAGAQHRIDFDSQFRARVKKQRSPSWFGGKPGILTRSDSRVFVTFSTHVATQALDETKYKFRSRSTWTDEVEMYHGNFKVGSVVQAFDSSVPGEFPDGFEYDVSLIDVTDQSDLVLSGLKAPKGCDWLSDEEWNSLRLEVNPIGILRSETMRSKTIAMSESREMVIGQAIFRKLHESRRKPHAWSSRKRVEPSPEEASKWAGLVSRALLYRVDPDFEEPRSNSGTAICVLDKESGTRKVAGFQSFVQEVDGGQYYEMDDDPFATMLSLGAVAFYGAFQVPPELRESHTIVTQD